METNGRRWEIRTKVKNGNEWTEVEVLTKVKIGNEWTEVGSTNES